MTTMTTLTTISGNVTRNTEPHQNVVNSTPATNGPRAEMAPPSADHSAIDLVRPAPVHSAVISDSVVG
jgi:hypothetical protein